MQQIPPDCFFSVTVFVCEFANISFHRCNCNPANVCNLEEYIGVQLADNLSPLTMRTSVAHVSHFNGLQECA